MSTREQENAPTYRRSEYKIWINIIQRCGNPKNPEYFRYGGAGIGICEEWRRSFHSFISYIGDRPTPKHSVDRIDGDKGYHPGNVRWATPYEQQQNKKSTIWLTVDGETKCVIAWAREIGCNPDTLYSRYKRGWSHSDIVKTPCIGRKASARKFSDALVNEIRERVASGVLKITIARQLGTSHSVIGRLVSGKTYADVGYLHPTEKKPVGEPA